MQYDCDVLVYSCITGNYDNAVRAVLSQTGVADPRVGYVLYTDTKNQSTAGSLADLKNGFWITRPLLWRHPLCARRTARWHKINSHLLDVRAPVTVWIDGSHRVRPDLDVVSFATDALRIADLATFQHPERTCVYQELEACKRYRKDNPILMSSQVERYRSEGYPAYAGMVETCCVVRRDTEGVRQFNTAWWQQIESGSYRDQLSFNYVARKRDFLYGILPGHRTSSKFFEYVGHG